MFDLLYNVDRAVLLFINRTLSSPVGDLLWPLITDYDRYLAIRIVLVAVWIVLLVKGGVRGRIVAIMLIPLLIIADQLSSMILKEFVQRARPCHEVDGVPVVQGLHMLVHCGGGRSFPSSHAVNNFAVATLFGFYYRKWRWAFFAWASLVALSRPAVGVHYPSDVLGGAIIGTLVALLVIYAWLPTQRRYFPQLTIQHEAVLPTLTDENQKATSTSH